MIQAANGDLSVIGDEEDRLWARQVIEKMPLWSPIFSSSSTSKNSEQYVTNNPYDKNMPSYMDILTTAGGDQDKLEALMGERASRIFDKAKGYDIGLNNLMTKIMTQMVRSGNPLDWAPGQEPWNRGN